MATLEGKSVVVVGGTSGIGFSVAKASLLSRAASVIIASSNQAKIDKTLERLREELSGKDLPGTVSGRILDAKNTHSVEEFVKGLGEIDHLVWTSGDSIKQGFKDVDLETFKDSFDVRFWGPVVAAQKANIKPGGSITLTTGQIIERPDKNLPILAGVAGAVDSLARGLALDLAPIRVNAISPGLVRTELVDGMPPEVLNQYNAVAEKVLVKHPATTDEIAEAYLFAMKCTYLTGQRIEVDGGQKYVQNDRTQLEGVRELSL